MSQISKAVAALNVPVRIELSPHKIAKRGTAHQMAAIRTLLLDHSKQESQGSSGSTRNALQQVDLLAKAHE